MISEPDADATDADMDAAIKRHCTAFIKKDALGERLKRIEGIRSELFTIANEFAVARRGDIAVLLHGACNQILFATESAAGNLSPAGRRAMRRQALDSCGGGDILDSMLDLSGNQEEPC